MKRIILAFFMAFVCTLCTAQSVTLTFTGRDANSCRVQLDRVLVTNLTRGWQETLTWPDTVLTLQNGTGIEESTSTNFFQLKQNNPNPFRGETVVELSVSEPGATIMEIHDMSGKVVEKQHSIELLPGTHLFRIHLAGSGIYVLNAWQNGKTSSIKMVNNGGSVSGIEYIGSLDRMEASFPLKNGLRGISTNTFYFGDEMEYVGHAIIDSEDIDSQHIVHLQGASQTIELPFNEELIHLATVTTSPVTDITRISAIVGGSVVSAGGSAVTEKGICYTADGLPTISDECLRLGAGNGPFSSTLTALTPGTRYHLRAYAMNASGVAYGSIVSFQTQADADGLPCINAATVADIDGNAYPTVKIGRQCWMKENLRTTRYADNTPIELGDGMSDRIPYYYYPNGDSNCVALGGLLYNWNAVMHHSSSSSNNPSGIQGICPDGWHVPSEAEWRQLTDYVIGEGSFACLPDTLHIAKSMAATTWWSSSFTGCAVGNDIRANNATGFTALPCGFYYGNAGDFSYSTIFWSATEADSATVSSLYLGVHMPTVLYNNGNKLSGQSVRCLKDLY